MMSMRSFLDASWRKVMKPILTCFDARFPSSMSCYRLLEFADGQPLVNWFNPEADSLSHSLNEE